MGEGVRGRNRGLDRGKGQTFWLLIALTAQFAIACLGATLQVFQPFVKLGILSIETNIMVIELLSVNYQPSIS